MKFPQADPLSRLVYQNAPLGMAVIHTGSGVIYDANFGYCALLGRDKNDVVGKTWMQFTCQEDVLPDIVSLLDINRIDAPRIFRKKRYVRPDGSLVFVSVTIVPLAVLGEELFHVSMVQDLTVMTSLREKLKERTLDAFRKDSEVFNSLAVLSHLRDCETGDHILRTKLYLKVLLENLPNPYSFSRLGMNTIIQSAALHDIGKLGIPDSILLKSGKLTKEEFKIMETHTTLGVKVINEIQHTTMNYPLFMFAREIVESHHERWDGSGYPHHLRADQIPLNARMMAIADVYDALRSERPYKKAYSHEESVRVILAESGTHFDPSLVKVFLACEREFARIALTENHVVELHTGKEEGVDNGESIHGEFQKAFNKG